MLTKIVKRALTQTVTNVGQLTAQEQKELNRAVKAGVLAKGKGGSYPLPKTVYAVPGYDFELARQMSVAYMLMLHDLDNQNRKAAL